MMWSNTNGSPPMMTHSMAIPAMSNALPSHSHSYGYNPAMSDHSSAAAVYSLLSSANSSHWQPQTVPSLMHSHSGHAHMNLSGPIINSFKPHEESAKMITQSIPPRPSKSSLEYPPIMPHPMPSPQPVYSPSASTSSSRSVSPSASSSSLTSSTLSSLNSSMLHLLQTTSSLHQPQAKRRISSSSSSPGSSVPVKKRKRWCPEKQKNYDRNRRVEENKALRSLIALLTEMDNDVTLTMALGNRGAQQHTRANVLKQAVETIQQMTEAVKQLESSLAQCEDTEAKLFQPTTSVPVAAAASSSSATVLGSAPLSPASSSALSPTVSLSSLSGLSDSDDSEVDPEMDRTALILRPRNSLMGSSLTMSPMMGSFGATTAPSTSESSSNPTHMYLDSIRLSLSSLLSKFTSHSSLPPIDHLYLPNALYEHGFVSVHDLRGRLLDANSSAFELLAKDSEGKKFDASEAVKGKINCSLFVHMQIDSLLPLFEVGCDEESIFYALLFSAQKYSLHEKERIPAEHERFLLENLMRVRGHATPRDVLQCMRACAPNIRTLRDLAALLSGRKTMIHSEAFGYSLNGQVLKIKNRCWALQKPSLNSSNAAGTAPRMVPYGLVYQWNMSDCKFVTAIHNSGCAQHIERTFLAELKKSRLRLGNPSSSSSSALSKIQKHTSDLVAKTVAKVAVSRAPLRESARRILHDCMLVKDSAMRAEDSRTKLLVVLGACDAPYSPGYDAINSGSDAEHSVLKDLAKEWMSDEDALYVYNKKFTAEVVDEGEAKIIGTADIQVLDEPAAAPRGSLTQRMDGQVKVEKRSNRRKGPARRASKKEPDEYVEVKMKLSESEDSDSDAEFLEKDEASI